MAPMAIMAVMAVMAIMAVMAVMIVMVVTTVLAVMAEMSVMNIMPKRFIDLLDHFDLYERNRSLTLKYEGYFLRSICIADIKQPN